ncbi:hypothetical protein E2C01_055314 [Portunus trituberculatus]|uniref:Uncharacterized protein n=1 Tax=Portunus trituberculatus TaxID=210409 RepID=A0A5B7GUH0_PORTR|nr:hypothetical protein [Portunus trituberculatus]
MRHVILFTPLTHILSLFIAHPFLPPLILLRLPPHHLSSSSSTSSPRAALTPPQPSVNNTNKVYGSVWSPSPARRTGWL